MEKHICKVCEKEYSRSETIRIYGDMWWTPLYCSAQCYTKAVMMEKGVKDFIYLVIRHSGDYDDYETNPIKAFQKEEKAKEFCDLCNEEAKRILDEIATLEKVHKELFDLPEEEDLMTEEELDEHGKKAQDHWCQVGDICKSHKYDELENMISWTALNYQYTPIELE